jgi:hypothetical protein
VAGLTMPDAISRTELEYFMGILNDIFGRIFHRGGKSQTQAQGDVAVATAPQNKGPAGQAGSGSAAGAAATSGGGAATATATQPVDVEAVLNAMAEKNPQKLNWRTSIVDLMKLLDLDSSLQARKALADELKYPGDKSDSAAMNIWLHKQVMKKLAENGGKVPADLKD